MRNTLARFSSGLVFLLATTSIASAATLRLPTTGNVRLNTSSSSSSSVSSSVSSTASSSVSSSKVSSSTTSKPNNAAVKEYCGALAATLAKGEKTTSTDATTQQRIDQTIDLLKKANALCGTIDFGASSSSVSSSACAPDGYMGVKGTCNGKSWSTGGVCMPKSYWETQVKQSCSSGMTNVSYAQPCMTKTNTCGTASSTSSTSSSTASCTTEGFKGAKILCGSKPVSSGGVCKPKSYWEAWAKQTCSGYTGFEVQVPCTAACGK